MKLRLFYIIFLTVFLQQQITSQELNCNVEINTAKIQGTNKQIFETLQTAITDFMNTRNWTNLSFDNQERIECNLVLTILEYDNVSRMTATLQVQSRRPVYGSTYNTTMLNYVDNDFEFDYEEFTPLEFTETSYISNLTSVLAFYAYIIIGLDADSFSREAGLPYFTLADRIVNNAQSGGSVGWRGADSRTRKNRYWLVNNLLDPNYARLREFTYTYHRSGLDQMFNNVTEGRAQILNSVSLLDAVNKAKPSPFMHFLNVLVDAKKDEIVQVFADESVPSEQKQAVYAMMVKLDPAGKQNYDPIK